MDVSYEESTLGYSPITNKKTNIMNSKRKILCVGLVCYDIVNVVEYFPVEDTQMRTIEQRRSRGGNASNMTTALSHLNVPCEFMGSLPSESSPDVNFVIEDFRRHNIEHNNCVRHPGYLLPNSCIILNRETGSRTILHTNDGLPELTLKDFSSLSYETYTWVHLEGRPNAIRLADIAKMIKTKCPNLPISLEMEKPTRASKDELFLVLPFIDLLFISKECASSLGATSMKEATSLLKGVLPDNAAIVCPWGEKGAAGKDTNGEVFEVPCYPPPSGIIARYFLIKQSLTIKIK